MRHLPRFMRPISRILTTSTGPFLAAAILAVGCSDGIQTSNVFGPGNEESTPTYAPAGKAVLPDANAPVSIRVIQVGGEPAPGLEVAVARSISGRALDFRWTGEPDDPAYLIEVNPRFWGGLNQAIESGWDYPWLLFQMAVDGDVAPPEEGNYDVRTEAPILGLLATLQEIAEAGPHMENLKTAWRECRSEFKEGSKRAGLKVVFSGLKEFIDVKGRTKVAKRMLEVHKDNVYDVLSARDPLPALGVFYPLAVFLKHGKVNMELLTSEGGPVPPEVDED